MKKLLFNAIVLLVCSAITRAYGNIAEEQMYLENDRKPIKSCIVRIIIVDENNIAIGSADVDISNPKSYTDCLNKGIEEAKRMNEAGVITEKVLVQSYS